MANWCTNFTCSLGFGDGLGLWLSSGHLDLLSGDGLGLVFWVMVLEGGSEKISHVTARWRVI